MPDRGRAMLVPRSVRQDRALNGLKFPDWAVAAMPVEPGPAGAKEAQFSLPIQAVSSFPKVQAMPSDATLAVNLTESELAESMLVPLVNQFGLMQQQMFDQFQQAMAMMVQMFGTMHRDQMEVIRTELNQLRELTEEFHALKNELANRSRAEMASSKALTSKSSNGLGVAPASSSPVIPPSSLTFITPGQQPSLEPRRSPTSPLSGPPVTSPTSEQLQEPGLCSPIRTSGAGLAANSDRDTVVWLHQRILSLQRERESRWQKILKLLPGMS
jgi:hypothetical protein